MMSGQTIQLDRQPSSPVIFKRILVAYDATAPADHALDLAARLARAFDGDLTVLSVVSHHPGRIAGDPWDDENVHQRELETARVMLRERGMEATFLLRSGEIAPTIERTIEDGGYDTVVLGSRGRGMAARFLQGSVSEHVATRAHATVVVTR